MFRFLLFVFAMSLTCFQGYAAEKVLKVVYFNYPPHVIPQDKGKPIGTTIDVWEKHIAPAAGVKIEWVGPVPFPRAMAMLESGEADAISLIAKNAERDAKFKFPKNPHIRGKQGIVTLKKQPLDSISSPEDLKGKVIGKLGAGYIPPWFEQHKDKIQFEEIPGDDAAKQNVSKVLEGRIWGAYFIFADCLIYHAAVAKKANEIKVVAYPGSNEDQIAYPAMSRKLDAATAESLEKAMESVQSKYDYHKMVDSFLKSL